MHDLSATCPLCRATHQYGAELIGRYTLCPACRGRFYIEVPPLGKPAAAENLQLQLSAAAASSRATTLDDLLWDTQRGNRFVIQSLRRIELRLQWHGYAFVALAALLLAVVATLVHR
jgi:hypothetical protein